MLVAHLVVRSEHQADYLQELLLQAAFQILLIVESYLLFDHQLFTALLPRKRIKDDLFRGVALIVVLVEHHDDSWFLVTPLMLAARPSARRAKVD